MRVTVQLLLVTLLVSLVARSGALPAEPPQPRAQCGYASCPAVKPGMLNVHLVPHTHDDVGWLKTIDQYFYGSRNDIQKAGVQYIIDSVITELLKDTSRRFIYVETAFFWQWWLEQDEQMRADVKGLVESGQLEFISGAWSMNDEAVTHYQSTVDQFTWGLRKLNDTFGECGRPRIGWQIDPFGHARETASMMAHMGFDGLFFARLDYQDKDQRMLDKTGEMVWQASQNQGGSSSLFTSILYYFYMAPPTFCFDIECNDEPMIDNKLSPDYNIERRVSEFLGFATKQADYYKTEHIIMTMGGDFNYQQADTWFKNLDKLIKYTNEQQETLGGKVNLLYSTPSCYLKSLNEAGQTWSTKTDDFFPYSSDPHAFWTGYFTSRPTLKYFERKGNNFLQVCKQLTALAELDVSQWEALDSLRELMGVMQHHDAITGTEKQHVAEDYALRLSQAFEGCHVSTEAAINKLMAVNVDSPYVPLAPCLLSNVSQCNVSETNDMFVVTLYNPLGHTASQFVRLPVPENADFKVYGPTGTEEVTQLVPIPLQVQNIPGRESLAKFELVFKAVDLPPVGFKTYYVEKVVATQKINVPTPVTGDKKYTIGNERVRAQLDPDTGRLKSLAVGGLAVEVDQTFLYYEGAVGNNEIFENRSSGAYIFRPQSNDAAPISDNVQVETFEGDLVNEIHQVYSDWVSQIIRTYEGEDYLEFEWLVGPIPIADNIGKEVISRFSTGWSTNGLFYTDSNGRETLERKRNFRPTWEVQLEEPVAGNYYPITTAISLKNDADKSELIVLTDRAQGGSSLSDGDLELMVHRRLLHDDAFGVGEALNEIAFGKGQVARGRHLVVLGSQTTSPTAVAQQRQLSMRQMVLAPWMLLAPTNLTKEEWMTTYKNEWSGLKAALPDNVHLLTLEPWTGSELLMRLEHFFETTDDPTLSLPASVNLEDIFTDVLVISAHETTLAGNQWLEESSRLEWTVDGLQQDSQQLQRPHQKSPTAENRFAVALDPMQIRTFVVRTGVIDSGAAVMWPAICLALFAALTALMA